MANQMDYMAVFLACHVLYMLIGYDADILIFPILIGFFNIWYTTMTEVGGI